MMSELIFASGNKGKIIEVAKIMRPEFITKGISELISMEEINEIGDTYYGNAVIKAEAVFKIIGRPVIADDSGLNVEQLNGRPGVYSARFAGDNATYSDNNDKLLRLLKDFPAPHRAKFVCCAVYYDGSKIIDAYGELEGEIISETIGSNGFGYDPVFKPLDHKRTLAEMSLEEKNLISHRSAAFSKLKGEIIEWRKKYVKET